MPKEHELKLVYVFGQGMISPGQEPEEDKKENPRVESQQQQQNQSKRRKRDEWDLMPSRIRERPLQLQRIAPPTQPTSICLVEEHLSSEVLAMSQESSVRYGTSCGLILLPDPDQLFVYQFLVDGNEYTQKHLLQECKVLQLVHWPSLNEPLNPHILKPKQMIAVSVPCGDVTYLMIGRAECKQARVGRSGGVEFVYSFASHVLHVKTDKENNQVNIMLSHPDKRNGDKVETLVTCSSVYRVLEACEDQHMKESSE